MRFLKEDYGESEELENFIYLLQRRFNPFYEVIYKDDRDIQHSYFAYEDAARDYYDKIKEKINSDRELYDGVSLTLNKVTLEQDVDELEDEIFYDEE